MTKKLNESPILNELKGESAYFRPPLKKETSPKPSKRDKPSIDKPNGSTERVNGSQERKDRTMMEDLEEGMIADKRPTERYSFEIYTDQKERLFELQYRYKKRTGQKLSSSRVIRESLDSFLDRALKILEKSELQS
jgi:hypothetical protein